MSVPRRPTRVLYIAGPGRNGSTLLDKVLGQHPDIFAGGELSRLWLRGLQQRRRCGCGQSVPDCPVWSRIIAAAFGVVTDEYVADTERRLAAASRGHFMVTGRQPAHADVLRSQLSTLYQGIANETDAEVIVDSSKTPGYLHLLRSTPGLDVRTVHLVRDPRAITYSWQRGKIQTDELVPRPMQPAGPLAVATGWTAWNLMLEGSRRRHAGTTLPLRYEDFMAAPVPTLVSVLEFAGLSSSSEHLPFRDQRSLTLEPTHSVSGNPGRFKNGLTTMKEDMQWQSRLSARHKRLVTVLTWPLARRYGY